MNIIDLKQDETEYHAKVTIPEKDITKQVEDKLAQVAQTTKINGFRAGKVPLNILRKKYAPSIKTDVIREKTESTIKNIIKDKKLNVAFEPMIEDVINEENRDLEFTLKFEILPEISLPEFKKITVEKPVLEISDEDIDEQVKKIAEFSKDYSKETKAKAKNDDQVTIDATGYVDGKAFDGGQLKEHKLVLGSKTFIPGFEDQLIGCKAGDEVVVKVDFPEDYQAKELAGKPSEFQVKVLAVHKAEPAKINDEFAKKFNCENVEDFRKKVVENIQSSYVEPIQILMKMKLFDQLEEQLNYNIPPSLLKKEVSVLLDQNKQLGDESEINQMNEQEKEKYLNELASRRIRIGLMLAEYVKHKKIDVTEDDIRQSIIAQARNYPGQEQQIIEFYSKNRNAVEDLKGPILEDKGVKTLFADEVTLIEKTYNKNDLEELLKREIRD
jgi:trigger factor